MKLQRAMSLVRQAVDDYKMIEEGDKIAVGISGGKDSLTLLTVLHGLSKYYPKKFEVCAVTVDLGYKNVDFDRVRMLCNELGVEYKIITTEIAKIVFDIRQEENPCALCAKMRKGALNNAILDMGCNKVAYAHHKDDVIETMMLSMMFEGRLHTFSPVTYLDQTHITVIRPMIYMSESDVIGFVNKYNLPVVKSPCPVDGHTKREYVKELVRNLNHDYPGIKNRMFSAIKNGIQDYNKESQESDLL